MPLIDFTAPAQSWPEFLDSMPPGRSPQPEDMYARWDSPTYICPARPRNGIQSQIESVHGARMRLTSGHCKCGVSLRKEGLQGVGESHAYLAWLAGMMSDAEAAHFWATVASAKPERLTELGILPVLRECFRFLREMGGV